MSFLDPFKHLIEEIPFVPVVPNEKCNAAERVRSNRNGRWLTISCPNVARAAFLDTRGQQFAFCEGHSETARRRVTAIRRGRECVAKAMEGRA